MFTWYCPSLLAEIDQCGVDEPEVEGKVRVRAVSQESQESQARPSQCSPLVLGGSLSSPGLSSPSRPRVCDRLLCLTCNVPVISVQNTAWTSDTDYIFLRWGFNL